MPYQDNSAQHEFLAVIDIGSNSVRMVIYDLTHSPPEKIFNEKVFCALGRDLATTGRLNDEAVSAAFKALRAYVLLAEIYRVEALRVVGTAALRDAHDGREFIARVKEEIGLDIEVISGDAEATYAAHGVMMLEKAADGVVADFGGGSLELARIKNETVFDTLSLPLGAYRVGVMGNSTKEKMLEMLVPHQQIFGNLPSFYGIGGSWRVLAKALMMSKGQDIKSLEGYRVSSSEMIDFCQKIKNFESESLRKTYRMELHHARLAPIAALTLEIVLEILSPVDFVVSTAGVRDGVVHEFLSSRAKNG